MLTTSSKIVSNGTTAFGPGGDRTWDLYARMDHISLQVSRSSSVEIESLKDVDPTAGILQTRDRTGLVSFQFLI